MITYLVTWIAFSSYLVACDFETGPTVDEFGVETYITSVPSVACFRTKESDMTRVFNTYDDAEAFIDKARKECGDGIMDGCKDFKIYQHQLIYGEPE